MLLLHTVLRKPITLVVFASGPALQAFLVFTATYLLL